MWDVCRVSWRYWVSGTYETDGLCAQQRIKRIYAVLIAPVVYKVLFLMFFSRVTPSGVCDPPAVRSSSASERTWITVPWWRLRCLLTNPHPPGLRTARGGCWSACFSGTELWGKPAWLSATRPMDIQLNTSRQRLTISQVSLWMRNCAILVISVDLWSQFSSSSDRCFSRGTTTAVHHINYEHVRLFNLSFEDYMYSFNTFTPNQLFVVLWSVLLDKHVCLIKIN